MINASVRTIRLYGKVCDYSDGGGSGTGYDNIEGGDKYGYSYGDGSGGGYGGDDYKKGYGNGTRYGYGSAGDYSFSYYYVSNDGRGFGNGDKVYGSNSIDGSGSGEEV